jgi:apolipoprotein D and lipocalin family protein
MMKYVLLLGSLAFMLSACAGTPKDAPPLEVVEYVDLERYLGTWYEIASYPAWFAKECTATTAEYSLLSDGKIRVINRCRKGNLDGQEKVADGKAEVIDTVTNAKLKVWFFWPFKGNYWIIDLDEDYQWAVVGEPSRKYLWILSRTPSMDGVLYEEIVARVVQQGYDPSRLQRTEQVTPTEKTE